MAMGYRLAVLAILIFVQDSTQEDKKDLQTSSTPAEPTESISSYKDIEVPQASPLASFEWAAQTGQGFESRRRRPDKGWGAFAPALLAISTILPLLLTGLAALAGKALMSSVLALAVAGFNLFRSTQPNPNQGF